MIKVLNKKTDKSGSPFYIGRGSVLGNPYDWTGSAHPQVRFRVNSREEAIVKYEEYLRREIESKNKDVCAALNEIYLRNKNGDIDLMCFCKPLACHGDIIKKIIEEKIEKTT